MKRLSVACVNPLKATLLALSLFVVAQSVPPALSAQPLQGQVSETKVVNYPDAEKHAQAIIDKIESANGLPSDTVQKVQVVKAGDLNAATDGQQIIISSALWNLLTQDDQRAFVISHEMSHITLNHIGHTQVRRIGLGLIDYLISTRSSAANSQLMQLATSAGLSMVDNKFSRQAEYQADDRGLALMSKAGYNPRAAIEVFNIFEKNLPNTTPEFLQNHPLNKARIQALAKKYPNVRS